MNISQINSVQTQPVVQVKQQEKLKSVTVAFHKTLVINKKNIDRMPKGLIEAYVKYKLAAKEFFYLIKKLGYKNLKLDFNTNNPESIPTVLKPLLPKLE